MSNILIEHLNDCLNPERCLERAKETGFYQRKGKIEPFEFFYSLCLGQLSALHPSLQAQALNYSEPVTRQAVEERYHAKAVEFFKAVFQDALRQSLGQRAEHPGAAALLDHFRAVKIFDSTHLSWPDALKELFPACGGDGTQAGLKVLLAYEYIHSQIQPLELLPSKRSDQGLAGRVAQEVGPEELALLDGGFFKGPALASIAQRGGFFVIPWPRSVSLWEAGPAGATQAVDLAARLRHSLEAWVELPAVTLGQGATAVGPLRLVCLRLREEVANRKRANLREQCRTHGRTPTAEALELAGWLILATNLPAAKVPAPVLGYVYRLRWQIELVFKQFKSVLRLDWVAGENPFRLLCEVWARLTSAVLLCLWHRHANAVAWATLASLWQAQGSVLAAALFEGPQRFAAVVANLWRHALKLARKEVQRSRKTTWENLQEHWLCPPAKSQADGTPALIPLAT
jgi:hypothetical protein